MADDPKICECGYEDGTFACRIRHQSVKIGWGRAQHQ